ncbi:rhomboid domain-containing protein 1 [Fistulifera solaris]|uniref:Rhomboid domain-containing protein 1 n=1 Tax=Fistulifera solaris TaxID=1519565 RepID=A0A1Z5JPP4_FISSO|nr:rhomboid domain-containing protein 1 [Fistulifera solaris]|eukprot:GAX16013.1 rhomboid domain-containing protein 1 [Fistulifera solaris]
MSRLNEEVQLVPPSTLTVIAFCVVVYGCQTILNLPLQTFTLCPQRIVEHWEVYRILTHAFFHANFLHIALNMLSAFAISSAVEKRVGTVYHLFSTFMSIVMISMVYIAISLLFLVIGNNDLYLQHSVGFSGVLFHMLVLDVTSSSQPRSLFGIIEVPPLFYPFALLSVLQLILPNISFYGHLSGIVTGFLHSAGCFDGILMIDERRLQTMEEWPFVNILTRSPSFVPATGTPLVSSIPSAVEPIRSFWMRMMRRFRQRGTEESLVGEEWSGLPTEDVPTQDFV